MRVKTNSPIRKTVADQSTYYNNKANAIQALDQALAYFNFRTKCTQLPDNSGNCLIEVVPIDVDFSEEDYNEADFYIYASWYRMESGRYEFTFYVT